MTEFTYSPLDIPTEVVEHALAHAVLPGRRCELCAGGNAITVEDFDAAVESRLYSARKLIVAMIKQLHRNKYAHRSLATLNQLLHEAMLLHWTKTGGSEVALDRGRKPTLRSIRNA